MTNYEKYFGTPEKAAESLESFMSCDVFHPGAWRSYGEYVIKNYDCRSDEDECKPWLFMWLQDEADA